MHQGNVTYTNNGLRIIVHGANLIAFIEDAGKWVVAVDGDQVGELFESYAEAEAEAGAWQKYDPTAEVEIIQICPDWGSLAVQGIGLESVQAIREAAKAWRVEHGDKPLDPEWSGTAYEDLPTSAQHRLLWEDFHAAVRATLVK